MTSFYPNFQSNCNRASTAGPFGFADKLTESLKNHKTAKEFDNIGNPYDVDHLTRKRIGPSHANYATGYFESGLRKPRHFRVNKLHKKQFYRYGKVDRKGTNSISNLQAFC